MKKNNFRKQLAVIVSTALLLNINMFTAYAVDSSDDTADNTTVIVTEEVCDYNYEYNFNIEVVDADTNKPIEGVHMYLVKEGKKWWEPFEEDIVAEWDTSDSAFISEVFKNTDGKYHGYELRSDILPDGYLNYNQKNFIGSYGVLASKGENKVTLKLSRGTLNTDELKDIPLSGTYSVTLSSYDSVSWENVENLECEIYNYHTGEVVAKWNSSKEPEKRVENLHYEFDNYDSITGNIIYCFRCKDSSGKYEGCNNILMGGATLDLFKKEGTDIKYMVGLENTHHDSPPRTVSTVANTQEVYYTGSIHTLYTTSPITTATSDIFVSSNSVTSSPESNSVESAPEIVYGDITGDGIVDITDLTELSLYLVKDRDFDENQKLVSDVVYDHNQSGYYSRYSQSHYGL